MSRIDIESTLFISTSIQLGPPVERGTWKRTEPAQMLRTDVTLLSEVELTCIK